MNIKAQKGCTLNEAERLELARLLLKAALRQMLEG